MQELTVITEFLLRVRRRLLARRALEASVMALVVGLVWVLGVFFAASALPDGWTARVGAWLLLAVSLVVVVGKFVGTAIFSGSGLRETARQIERTEPALRNDLVTSLQYGMANAPTLGTSEALVKALLRNTARSTERYRHRVHTLFPRRDLAQPLRSAALLAAVIVMIAVTLPERAWASLQMLTGLSRATMGLMPSSEEGSEHQELLVEDLDIELVFPGYTGLRRRTLRNTSGSLEVLAGTDVRFEGRLRKPAETAVVVLETEGGTRTEIAARVEGERVIGSFAALAGGHYRFRLGVGGRTFDNDVPRRITVLPDHAPIVAIEQPVGVVEVTGDEIVTLQIRASDDFGLSEVALVYAFDGVKDSEERAVVARVDHQASYAGEAVLDLGTLQLRPKDMLEVRAEVLDNNAVSTPSATRSVPVMLRVTSPEDRHEGLIREQQELVEQLLDLLGLYLDQPILADEPGQMLADAVPDTPASDDHRALLLAAQQTSTARGQVLRKMADVLSRMELDTLMLRRDYELFRALYDDLYSKHRDAVDRLEILVRRARGDRLLADHLAVYGKQHRIPQVSSTERAIIRLEELIASEWLDAAQMTVDQIRETKARLKQLLEQYREAQDPGLKAEILKEIERMQRQMAELLTRLAQQADRLPPEHLNSEAFSEDNVKELAESAASLREMLESGDIDGALEALERLDQGLEAMLAMQDSYTAGGGGNGLSKLDQKANELMDAVNDLAEGETALQKQTSELASAQRERHTDALEGALEPFLEEQAQRLEDVKRALEAAQAYPLNDRDQAALSEIERARASLERVLELKDIEGMRPLAERLGDAAQQATRRMTASRFDVPRADPARNDYDKAKQEVERVDEIADAMERDIDSLLRQAKPQPTPAESQAMQELAGQQAEIRKRADALHQQLSEASAEFPNLEESLAPPLEQAKDFMQRASKDLDEGGLPQGLENEAQALRSLRAMKRKLQQTLERERMQGQQKAAGEHVEIPKEERRAPKAFREDILDAMKQPGLPTYEDENTLYYEALIE